MTQHGSYLDSILEGLCLIVRCLTNAPVHDEDDKIWLRLGRNLHAIKSQRVKVSQNISMPCVLVGQVFCLCIESSYMPVRRLGFVWHSFHRPCSSNACCNTFSRMAGQWSRSS